MGGQTLKAKLLLLIFVYTIAFPTTPLFAYDNPYCDSFCSRIVNPSTDQVIGLNGTDGWTSTDTAACTAYNSTNTTSTAVSTSAQQTQCQWNPTQVVSYCLAYEAPASSNTFQKIVLALDLASAATCWVACADPLHATESICSYSSITAGAAEIAESFMMKSSKLNKTVDLMLAMAGVAGGLGTLYEMGAAASAAKTATSLGNAAGEVANEANAMSGTSVQGALSNSVSSDLSGAKSANQAASTASTRAREMSCGTAALMTVMGVLRLKDINAAANSQQSACNSVQSLTSNSATIAGTVSTTPTSTVGTGSSTTSTTGTSGSMNSSLGTVTPSCAQNGLAGCSISARQIASIPEGKILNSGLAQASAAQAATVDTAGLIRSTASGQTAGSAVGQMLGGAMSNGELAKAIQDLATSVDADLPATLLPASVALYSSAGGTTNSRTISSTNSISTSGISAYSENKVGGGTNSVNPSDDIWHSGYTGSVFDIVHQKISVVRQRVADLPWSTPMNRALTAAPAQ